jgi:hypothetical protein
MNGDEIKKIINSEISKFINDSLDKEVKKIMVKSNSQTRSEMIDTIKNSLEAVYKMLWVKRDFWKTDIR